MKNEVRAAAAMILASSLLIGLPLGGNHDALIVPLLEPAAQFRDLWGLTLLKLVHFTSFLLLGFRSGVFILGATTSLVAWLAFYSATGAFVPQIVFNCLFMSVILQRNANPETNKKIAALFASSIFLIAGLQKINGPYLSGVEFQSPSGFLAFTRHFFGPIPVWLSGSVLPPLSIAIELTIGVGLFLRPRMFSHLASVFILFLMYIHPTLILPYLTFASTTLLVDPKFGEYLQKRFWKIPIHFFGTWLAILLLFQSLRTIGDKSAIEYLWVPASFATVFLGFHLSYLLRAIKLAEWRSQSPASLSRHDFSTPVIALAGLLILVTIGSRLGGPAPLGFSMFSAQAISVQPEKFNTLPRLIVNEEGVCKDLKTNFVRLIVTDAALKESGNSCAVAAPTESGLRYLRRKLCERHAAACANDQALLIRAPSQSEIPE